MNAGIYALMAPMGFFVGTTGLKEKKRNAMICLGIETVLEFIAVYSYTDVIAGKLMG